MYLNKISCCFLSCKGLVAYFKCFLNELIFIPEQYAGLELITLSQIIKRTYNIGVRQGDSLSPTLFMLFINNLALEDKKSRIRVKIEEPESNNNNASSPVVDNTLY